MILRLFNRWKRDENSMRKVDKDMLQSIKSKVDAFLTVGDAMDAVKSEKGTQNNSEDIPTRKKLRLQLCLFCIYLCTASDKPMTKTDAGIISHILNKDYDLDLLNTYAKAFDIDKHSFGCAIPEIFEMITLEARKGYITKWCNQFIEVHRMLSVEYMTISGRTAENQSPGKQYVNMLEKYAAVVN